LIETSDASSYVQAVCAFPLSRLAAQDFLFLSLIEISDASQSR